MANKVPCTSCATEILEITAQLNDGLCQLCLKGSFNCAVCGKKVLITEGVNDDDKICIGCISKVPKSQRKELFNNKKREFSDEDIVVVYFPNGIKNRDKIKDYENGLNDLLQGQAEVVKIDEKKFSDSIIISNFEDYWSILELVEQNTRHLISDENFSAQGVRATSVYLEQIKEMKKGEGNTHALIVLIILILATILYFVFT